MGAHRRKGERNECKLILDTLTNNTHLTQPLVLTYPQVEMVTAAVDFSVILLFIITLDSASADASGTPWIVGVDIA